MLLSAFAILQEEADSLHAELEDPQDANAGLKRKVMRLEEHQVRGYSVLIMTCTALTVTEANQCADVKCRDGFCGCAGHR